MFGIQPGDIVDVIGLIVIVGGLCVWLSKRWGAQHRPTIYRNAIRLAAACRDDVLVLWMRRGARRAYLILKRLYGARNLRTLAPHRGYLSQRAFVVSMQLATSYLMIGGIVAAGTAVVVGNQNGLRDRLLGLALVIAAAVSIYRIWRMRQRLVQNNPDWFGSLIASSLVCIAALTVAGFFGQQGRPAQANPLDKDPLLFVFAFVTLLSIWYALVVLNRAFRRLLPIGLLLFIPVSGILFIAMNEVWSDLTAGRPISWNHVTCIAVLTVRATAYRRIDRRPVRVMFNALAALVLLIPLFGFLNLPGHTLGETIRLLTQTNDRSRIPLIAFPFMAGAGMAIIGSLTYANAMCDWMSVAVTRRLLVALATARRTLDYAKFVGIDIVIAMALVIGTYLLFTALTHIFLIVVPIPAEEFLQGLRSLITEAFESRGQGNAREFDTYTMGSGIGKFAGIFALTALIPTAFHLALLAFVLIGRLVMMVLSVPAQEILRTRHTNQPDVEAVPTEAAIDQVIRVGVYATCAAILAAYLIARHFGDTGLR